MKVLPSEWKKIPIDIQRGESLQSPYYLDYARLASGAFYETIVPVTFYEIGKPNDFGKRNPPGTAEIKIRIEISPERFYRAD
jgi:hypothetical protein